MRPKRPGLARVSAFVAEGLEVLVIDLPGAEPALDALTRAEREVARLAASGLQNDEIARARGTTTSTVANQLGAIYRKLGVGSRFELAAWWKRAGARRASPR